MLCIGGDVIIAPRTLHAALALTRRKLGRAPAKWEWLPAIAISLILTAYNNYVKHAWAYAPMMPTVRFEGIAIGIAPLAQWALIPALAFWCIHRQMAPIPG